MNRIRKILDSFHKVSPSKNILAKWILSHIFSFSNELSLEDTLSKSREFGMRKHHFDKIVYQLENNIPVSFILPAFPAKSPNREKTLGDTPDMGEVFSLHFLNQLCEDIQQIHQAGAKITICSDGRVFSDLVLVDDEKVDTYGDGVRDIIEQFGLEHLDTYNLEDVFPQLAYDEMRSHLSEEYGTPVEEIREKSKRR